MTELITEVEAMSLRRQFSVISLADPLASKKIANIYELAGGFNVFKRADLPTYLTDFRESIVGAWEFPEREYLELFRGFEQFTSRDIYTFSHHRQMLRAVDVFTKLWHVNKAQTFMGITRTVDTLLDNSSHLNASREDLPIMHSDQCLAGLAQDHRWCRVYSVSHGDEARKFYEGVRQGILKASAPEIISILEQEALTLSSTYKEPYAQSVLVADDHWRPLMDDKRPILTALAKNPLLPEGIAYDILTAHKSSSLRQDIAKNAASKDLLDYIWKSTKSKDIRRAVASNALSGKYITNPDYLKLW
jgi:hypothetical protein